MGYKLKTSEDYERSYENTKTLLDSKKLGVDANATLELSTELLQYATSNWEGISGERVNALKCRLAECIATSDASFSPKTFKQQQRTCGLPDGETLHKNAISIVADLCHEAKLASLITKMQDQSYEIAQKTMSASELKEFENMIMMKTLSDDYDKESEQTQARDRIYAKHDIHEKMFDRELPYYVSDDMENSGVQLDK